MTLILSTTAIAPRTAPIIMPVEDIALWACPGVDAQTSIINFAPAAAPMTTAGSITSYGPRYADLKSVVSAKYFGSGVSATPMTEWSLISIYQPIGDPRADQNAPQLISACTATGGNWYGQGLGCYATVSGAVESRTFYAARGSFSGQIGGAGAAVENFVQLGAAALPVDTIRAVAFRGQNGGIMRVDDLTEGRYNEVTDARTTISPPFTGVENFRLGSSGNGTTRYGGSRHFADVIVPRFVTDTELDRIVGQAVRSLAADGVAVTLA